MAGQLALALGASRPNAISVTELVRIVREALDVHLPEYWVVGEVSNARLAPSNHFYFTLKDASSAVSVVMFRSAYGRLRFKVNNGLQVVVRGRVSLYETRGTLQLYAEEIEPRGLGALQLAFEQLKRRLEAEGLFDPVRKRPLPFIPRVVGLVTAPGSAALHDMMTIMLGRYPNLGLIIRPVRVQGAGAEMEIAQAIEDLNRHGRAEVIIVGRGGGSLEDLWAFNEEVVARAIRRSRVPVISAVGHEVDYTIADFASDLRAATPTAAAQLVVPLKEELRERLADTRATLTGAIAGATAAHRKHLQHLTARLREPRNLIRQSRQRIDDAGMRLGQAASRVLVEGPRLKTAALGERLAAAGRRLVELRRHPLGALAARLDSLSPLRVLDRGYAVVTNLRDASLVRDSARVEIGDELQIRLHRGRLRALTTAKET